MLGSIGNIRRWLFILPLSLVINGVIAQTDCIDYGTADFPKTINGTVYTWNGDAWNFPNMKENKITGLNIGGSYFFKGLLEYLPDDYDPGNTSIKHPVIIYFHGGASAGEGTVDHLCRLFKDRGNDLATYKSIPGRVERNTELFTQSSSEYIVVSPQFTVYRRNYPEQPSPNQNVFPGAAAVEDVIDFVVARYGDKLDLSRIYLTGYSNGANMIMEYAGSSVARAQRIAALMAVSLCSQLNHFSNVDSGISAANIGIAKLKTWFVYCQDDNCGYGPALNVPQNWVDGIKAVEGSVTPRYTVLRDANSDPLYQCSDTLLHDAWSRAYDPNFKASFVNGTGANDGINLNMYEWFIQQTNSVLPITLKSFTARLVNDKVELKWITTDERGNASFTIERAAADQRFGTLGTLPGSNNSTGEKEYSFSDDNPLAGLGFYRLVQTDIDGQKHYFEIKKILNQGSQKGPMVIVSPNPFTNEVSAFVSIESSQKLTATLTDISGKVLKSVSGIYGQGSSEIKLGSGNLAKGIYLLKISGEHFSNIQKVVKR